MRIMRDVAAIAVAVAIGLSTTMARAEDQKLYLYTWSDYIPGSVLKGFTQATGINVVMSNYESVEMAETKLLAGSSGFDLVVTAGFTVPRLIKAKVLGKLDHGSLPNIGNLDADFVRHMLPKIDAQTSYAIPYDWGLTTLGYNVTKVKQVLGDAAPTDSLALLFDPANAAKLQSCGISLLDSAADVVGLALLYTGAKDIYHPTSAEFDRAEAAIKAIRPYVRYFDNTRYVQDLQTGELCLSMGWSNDVVRAAAGIEDPARADEIKVMLPKEGALVWSDQFVMPADAPHPAAAQAFLNYLLQAQSGAAVTAEIGVATPNAKALSLIPAGLRGNPGIFPPAAWMQQQLPLDTFDLKVQREVTRRYTQAKAGD